MLLRNIVLLVDIALQCSKDAPLFEKVLATITLKVKHALVGDSIHICGSLATFGRYGKILQFFP